MALSSLSLVAVGLYLLVASGAIIGSARAVRLGQAPWHRLAWGMIALMFIIFGLMRVFGIEEMLEADLRSVLYIEQRYDERRALQGPLFGVIFIAAATVAAGLFYLIAKGAGGHRNVIMLVALGCTGGMIVLATLRMISLHSVDAMLYGPLKINWIMDMGLSVAVLGCALRYLTAVR